MSEYSIDNVIIKSEVDFRKIITFSMRSGVNEHAELEVYGLVKYTNDEDIGKMYGKKLELQYISEDEITPVFAGVIQNIQLSFNGQESYIKISCLSYSSVFDKVKQKRFFQNTKLTYQQLFNQVASEGRSILFINDSTQKLETPLLQYDETDWAFCKRIAGRLSLSLIPEISGAYPQIAIGVIKGNQHKISENLTYKALIDFDAYRRKKHISDCRLQDFRIYEISVKENFMLGDKIIFMGVQLTVMSKYLNLFNGQAEFTYRLGTKESMAVDVTNNNKICGLTLNGTVHKCYGEKIKLKLDIEEQSDDELYAFDYVPITGNMMYSMPETGAKVGLYFPNEIESNGMVTESISENVDYPNSCKKVFMTKEKKVLDMKPEGLVCESIPGNMKLEFSDGNFIKMNSDKKISISANGKIRFQTGGIVTCENPIGYYFENRETKAYIEITGNEVILSADYAVMTALPHKLGNKPVFPGMKTGLKKPLQYVSNILGGIPQGENFSTAATLAIGGIPICTDPEKQRDMADLVFIGRRR